VIAQEMSSPKFRVSPEDILTLNKIQTENWKTKIGREGGRNMVVDCPTESMSVFVRQ
jgi:hypothetical protein